MGPPAWAGSPRTLTVRECHQSAVSLSPIPIGVWHGGPNLVLIIGHMTIQRMEHAGIVVDNLSEELP